VLHCLKLIEKYKWFNRQLTVRQFVLLNCVALSQVGRRVHKVVTVLKSYSGLNSNSGSRTHCLFYCSIGLLVNWCIFSWTHQLLSLIEDWGRSKSLGNIICSIIWFHFLICKTAANLQSLIVRFVIFYYCY
jgi:hypothetical protein